MTVNRRPTSSIGARGLAWVGIGGGLAGLLALVVLAYAYKVLKSAHTRPEGGTHAPAEAGAMDAAVMRLVFGLIRTSLKAGLRVGPMMMLTVVGRSSGTPRTNPVDLFEKDGKAWLVATHEANPDWVRNLRAAGRGQLSLGRTRFSFTARELPQDQAGGVLHGVLAPRMRRRFAGAVLRQTVRVPPDAPLREFVAAAASHPVFEVELTRLE